MMMLPYPPSSNRIWRVWRGRNVLTPEARNYKMRVVEIAKMNNIQFIDGPVVVEFILHPKRPKDWQKREKLDKYWADNVRCIDINNSTKLVLDAFNGIAYLDDKFVFEENKKRGEPIENGGLSIEIRKLVK